jgi:hypothetical protein
MEFELNENAYLLDIASIVHDLDHCSFASLASTFRKFLEAISDES